MLTSATLSLMLRLAKLILTLSENRYLHNLISGEGGNRLESKITVGFRFCHNRMTTHKARESHCFTKRPIISERDSICVPKNDLKMIVRFWENRRVSIPFFLDVFIHQGEFLNSEFRGVGLSCSWKLYRLWYPRFQPGGGMS